ncbi:MAG: hypothetical protein R3C97_09405 [Geminicoccaceae bacterium]
MSSSSFSWHVQLISRDPFIELKLDIPEIGGVERITALAPKTGEFDTYGGEGYLHETVLALFPQESGTLHIPAFVAKGRVEDRNGDYVEFSSATPETDISVHPALELGDAGGRELWWLPSPSVRIEEDWSIPLDRLHIGDVVRRTVRIIADGARAEQLPMLVHRITPGITLIEGPRYVRTLLDGAGVTGELVQSWDIRVDSEYPVHFAPISVEYYDTVEKRFDRVHALAARIEPLPVDAATRRQTLMAEAVERHDRANRAIAMLVAALAFAATALMLLLLWIFRPGRSPARLHGELLEDGIDGRERLRRIRIWMRERGLAGSGHEVRQLLNELERSVFSAGAGLHDPHAFCRRLAQLERQARIAWWKSGLDSLVRAVFGERVGLGKVSGGNT